ncbi:hypothetical protein HS088_TW11G00945 [Tripterygium wilfordii]|uniref:Uncharacterized protein n=1 Tax=Tripterygium wilfordii TaxID=458696 RepID=A0A7J7D3C9_TRIWF|nr:uncharacterized protein LOC120009061 isoform X2 [Tripterygium wilfordii]KAF5740865.1 hypothetical protein HS088_TW11G00945 [Tripterygium wilfordii]
MEQSISACHDFDSFDEDETEVAAIFLELPELISKSSSDFRSENSVSWSRKKRRSGIQDSLSRFREPSLPLPPLQPQPQPRRDFIANVNSGPLEVEPKEPNVKVVQATSPATPLSFSPSETDEKRECFKTRRSHNKEKLMMEETIDQISLNNEVLQMEIENVKRHHHNLQTENKLLKARKTEIFGLVTVGPSLNLSLQLPPATVKSPFLLPSQPLIVDRTGQAQSLTLFNGVPDLNESVPDPEATEVGSVQAQTQQFYLGLSTVKNKAVDAAQARKRRIEICRAKLRHASK